MSIVTIINNKILDDTSNIYDFTSNFYGSKNNFKNLIIKRLEIYENKNFLDFTNLNMDNFLYICHYIYLGKNNLKDFDLNNIYLIHFLMTYRGWRHVKGLPVRGQRTWTNAWSVYRNNTILRNYRKEEAKAYYISAPIKESVIAYEAEYVNVFWKTQFKDEWLSAYGELLRFNGHPSTIRFELFLMANYQIMFPEKLEKLSKKKKQAHSKNSFSLGFEVGFTQSLMAEKYHIDELINSENTYSGSKLIFRDERPLQKKKKNTIQKKSNKQVFVKKKKKSVWD